MFTMIYKYILCKWEKFRKFLSSKKTFPFYSQARWLKRKPVLGMQSRTSESDKFLDFSSYRLFTTFFHYYFSEAVSVHLPKDG